MTATELVITILSPDQHARLVPSLAQIHMDCIMKSHTIATFLPPLDRAVFEKHWKANVDETRTGRRDIIMALLPGAGENGVDLLVGYVMLIDQSVQTGPFRGRVEKLLVSPDHRQRGIARKLMAKLEEIAWPRGLWLLTLDTEEDSPAEFVYPRFGYVRLGRIPDYLISPKDGSFKAGIFFHKDLRQGRLQA